MAGLAATGQDGTRRLRCAPTMCFPCSPAYRVLKRARTSLRHSAYAASSIRYEDLRNAFTLRGIRDAFNALDGRFVNVRYVYVEAWMERKCNRYLGRRLSKVGVPGPVPGGTGVLRCCLRRRNSRWSVLGVVLSTTGFQPRALCRPQVLGRKLCPELKGPQAGCDTGRRQGEDGCQRVRISYARDAVSRDRIGTGK